MWNEEQITNYTKLGASSSSREMHYRYEVNKSVVTLESSLKAWHSIITGSGSVRTVNPRGKLHYPVPRNVKGVVLNSLVKLNPIWCCQGRESNMILACNVPSHLTQLVEGHQLVLHWSI